jgi:hypothetical protein
MTILCKPTRPIPSPVAGKNHAPLWRTLLALSIAILAADVAYAGSACPGPGCEKSKVQKPAPVAQTALGAKTDAGPAGPRLSGAASTAPAASASSKQAIIFVGGKPSSDKAALNPQPIPPGHAHAPDAPPEH